MKDKYLSVLTNFGCHFTCPYCVVKNCGIDIPKTTIEGLDRLEEMVKKYSCNWVSLSGGGDPCYNLEFNYGWYNRLFEIADNVGVKLELHTSYLNPMSWCDYYFPERFDRIVYHCRSIADLFDIQRFADHQIVRVVYVVTEDFTPEMIDAIATIVKHHPDVDELSFRQMIGKDYHVAHYCEDYLRDGHKKDWWYIEQADYNIYYAENEVKFRYEDFKKE